MKNAKRAFTLVEIMIVVLIIGILLAIAVPNFIRAREQSRAKACSSNLKQIDAAKQQWAMDNKIPDSSTTSPAFATDLVGANLYMKVTPTCPSTGTSTVYTIGNINTNPICANSAPTKGFYHTVDGQAIAP